MALSKLSGDEQGVIFTQLCNVLDPRVAVCLSSVSHELREATQALLQQLRTGHKAAAALSLKMGMRSCKELREAKENYYNRHDFKGSGKGLSAADLETLGTLGSVLLALKGLRLTEPAAGLDGVQRLAAGLGAGALPAVTNLQLTRMHVGDAGASALAAALGRGALPRLDCLALCHTGIGDAGMVALAPALRRLPALTCIYLEDNPFGDEGIAALVAPPPPVGGLPPPKGVLTKLTDLYLGRTQITDAGCAALATALGSGALPELRILLLNGTFASAAAKAVVNEARDNLYGCLSDSESEEDEDEEDEEDDGEGN